MNKEKNKSFTKKRFWLLKLLGKIFLGVVILLFLLILFIRSPWGQDVIVQKATKYVSEKTNSKVEIEKLFITFSGNIMIEGLFLEDQNKDTLLYSKSLEADIPLIPIIQGKAVGVESVVWSGLTAKVLRKDTVTGFNFQFLIDAFASSDNELEDSSAPEEASATPLEIIVGDINLSQFDIVYNDDVTGIDGHFKFGDLTLAMNKTDAEAFDFRVAEAAISDARMSVIQKPSQIVETDTTASTLPFLALEKLKLTNVEAFYESTSDALKAEIDIAEFFAELPKIDLTENVFELNEISLANSSIAVYSETKKNDITEKVEKTVDDVVSDVQLFSWPELRLNIEEINLENNTITYLVNDEVPVEGVFNPNAIKLEQFTMKASDIRIKDKEAGMELGVLSFHEGSGMSMDQFAFELGITDSQLSIADLIVGIDQNTFNGQVDLGYTSVASLLEKPEESKVDIDISSFQIDLQEVFRLQPDLKNNEYLNTLSSKLIRGEVKVSGDLAALEINKGKIGWGNQTEIITSGTITNVTDIDKMQISIPNYKFTSTKKDMAQFISLDESTLKLPSTIQLGGSLNGELTNLKTNSKLVSEQGVVSLKGYLKSDNEIAFGGSVDVQAYKIGDLLVNELLGPLTLHLEMEGKGSDLNNLDATVMTFTDEFSYNNYPVKDLQLNGEIKNGFGKLNSRYKDENLNAILSADIRLDSIASEIMLDLEVIGADLKALGVMDNDTRAALNLTAEFKGNTEEYDLSAKITEGIAVYDSKSYLLGNFDVLTHVTSDTTALKVDSKMIKLDLESNANPQSLFKAWENHMVSYFNSDYLHFDSITDPVHLKIRGKISQDPILNEVFMTKMEDMDTINIQVDFEESARYLTMNIAAPHINYSDNEIDNLVFSLNTDTTTFNFNLGFNEINTGPLSIQQTSILGSHVDHELNLEFLSYYQDSVLVQMKSVISGDQDSIRFHIDPENLILNSSAWETPQNNSVLYTPGKLEFQDFTFSNNSQSIGILSDNPAISNDHITAEFKNFKLSDLLSYFNPEETLAEGELQGNFTLDEPFGKTGLLADLHIDNLGVLEMEMGTLSLDAKSKEGDNYDFNLELSGADVDLEITGDYLANDVSPELNLDLQLKEVKMIVLEHFAPNEFKSTSGSFSGDFYVSGRLSEPEYNGSIRFQNAGVNIAKFNAPLALADEKIIMDNTGLTLNKFTVLDGLKNTLIISGKIGTESLVNPSFDLQVVAKNFQVLNATINDNDFLFGTAAFDGNATIKGDLDIPVIDMKLVVSPSTDVTYVLPSDAANIEERDGVVIFVNRKNQDAILTRTDEVSATLTGFDIKALLKVNEGAKIKVIIDEDTGDNFLVSGDGDLIFGMDPNGRMSLTGVYEVKSGHYEMNLYKLVNKRFELAPGSKVSWAGDPFDARLDIKAIYEQEASASSLMASVTSGSDPATQDRYKQQFPFLVYLNINGELTAPEISFALDMPEDKQGVAGGQVYSRLMQINKQEDELNKQVFSLLVLNRFYPNPGSDGSSGGIASVARDNLNDALSDQLNMFSNKLVGQTGVQLDFGLDSYTDYQGDSPQERTQLDIAAKKKLFDDRLVVSVGSEVDIQGSSQQEGETTPLIGKVSIEYLLTEDGQYILKGFRRNEFENVIDGQTIVSGIALIFSQEFNHFDEFWDAIFRANKNKPTEEKKN